MDDDAKTLLAILALVYGSSNGLGLFKDALDPVKTQTNILDGAMKDIRATVNFVTDGRKKLFRALWSLEVLVYVALVILLPLFLLLVLWFGAQQALSVMGLSSSAGSGASRHGSPFYWVLLVLALLSSTHYLSAYLKGWRCFGKSLKWKQKPLIVDEAHDCRNADRLRFRFVYSIQALRRVFLTATPIHNSGYDIFNLATLLRPGCLGQRRFFAERHMAGKRLLKNSEALQQELEPMMTRTLRREAGIRFAEREFKLIEIEAFKREESVLYDELLQLLRSVYQRHMGGAAKIARPSGKPQYVSQFVLIAMLVLREMASHPLAAIKTLETALRGHVAEFAKITHDDSDLVKLDRFIERYTSQSWDVAHHAKSERLMKEARLLFAEGKKFVVYVNYLKTLEELVKQFAKQTPGARIVSYEGTMDQAEKTEAMELFRSEPKACLVSTDSGGQGLNLQFADCVVNYDFPWNPMRIEQRIGRVDRVKQESKLVRILNCRTRGTVEEYVQIVLTSKLKEVKSVLGEFSSPLQIEKIYEDKLTMGIGKALMESADADDMRKRMMRLGEDELKRYVGDYSLYEQHTPEWTWRPRD